MMKMTEQIDITHACSHKPGYLNLFIMHGSRALNDRDVEIWGQRFLKMLTSSGLSVTILLVL